MDSSDDPPPNDNAMEVVQVEVVVGMTSVEVDVAAVAAGEGEEGEDPLVLPDEQGSLTLQRGGGGHSPGGFRRNSVLEHREPPSAESVLLPTHKPSQPIGIASPSTTTATTTATTTFLHAQPPNSLSTSPTHFQIITPSASPGRPDSAGTPRQQKMARPIVSYCVAAQQGFRLMGAKRMRLHDEMEDVAWTEEPFNHPITGLPVWIQIMADGHGGVGAPNFFVNRLKELIRPVLVDREWNFDEVDDRNEFSNIVRGLFASMDDEYVTAKKLEYLAWREAEHAALAAAAAAAAATSAPATTTPQSSPPHSSSSDHHGGGGHGKKKQHSGGNDHHHGDASHGGQPPIKKPVDDGCTLILNCVYNGYFVNVNVGDSRTILCRQPRVLPNQQHTSTKPSPAVSLSSSSSSTASNLSMPKQKWTLYFSSVDHSPSHPEKALYVSKHGGIFINDNGTRRNVKIDEKRKKPYPDLIGARILRPLDENVKVGNSARADADELLGLTSFAFCPENHPQAIGVSHLRTLNLASTMGDLLYKIPPAVLSCQPDVSFVRLTPMYEYLLVSATDGLWDHLKINSGPDSQAKSVIGWMGEEWDKVSEGEWNKAAEVAMNLPASLRRSLTLESTELEDAVSVPGHLSSEEHTVASAGALASGTGMGHAEDDSNSPTKIWTRSGGSNGAQLTMVAKRLADREKNTDLYFGGWIRVDDCNVVLAHIRGLE